LIAERCYATIESVFLFRTRNAEVVLVCGFSGEKRLKDNWNLQNHQKPWFSA